MKNEKNCCGGGPKSSFRWLDFVRRKHSVVWYIGGRRHLSVAIWSDLDRSTVTVIMLFGSAVITVIIL